MAELKDGTVFVGELFTVGRKTGLSRPVEVRFVYLDGKFFVTTARIESKHWCKNMLRNPSVEVRVKKMRLPCQGELLKDESLRLRVLELRDSPALTGRQVFQITPVKG